jgi:WD40 repeat protein
VAVAPGESAGGRVAAGSSDGSIVVWTLATGEELARFAPSDSSVSCLRWSPEGDRLAVSFGDFSNRESSGLVIWSPLSDRVLAQASLDQPAAALAWLLDGDRLLVANWNGAAWLWQADLEAQGSPISLGTGGKLLTEAANWSADCPLSPALASGDVAIRVE